jgi:glucose-6-phosphate 1-dehydrogenase
MPAFYSLFLQNLLPQCFCIVAFARRDKTDEDFRRDILDAVIEFRPDLDVSPTRWNSFADKVYYHQSNLDDHAGYLSLKHRLQTLDSEHGLNGNRLFYLATPPDYFQPIIEQLHNASLSQLADTAGGWKRIMIEKPFGYDLSSAQELNSSLLKAFPEEKIFRLDHYLGKETVQNILVMRFANQLFEILWNHLYIDNVQITVAETLGMEGRGDYFDRAGILRDIIQNHALQILTLIAMEPPVSLSPNHIRDEKVKVLNSIRPFTLDELNEETVRAQYTETEAKIGYLQEDGIAKNSQTETFAALRFHLDNWRWAGVPFYVRAGKQLPLRLTQVVIQLKDAPDVLFARMSCMDLQPNRIILRIQPDEGVEIVMSAKDPGTGMSALPVRMHFDYKESFGSAIPDAYERLILNAILGDASLFARNDEVEAAWKLMNPVLEGWADSDIPPCNYRAGTWGPRNADAMLATEGRTWWNG